MTGAHRQTWAPGTSRRTTPLPRGWKKIRQAVLTRDGYQCTMVEQGHRCPSTTGLEVDHLGDPDDHSLDSLATKCAPHHASKTGHQANAVRWSRARAAEQSAKPPHPGLLG